MGVASISPPVSKNLETQNSYPALFGDYIIARTKHLLDVVQQDDFVHSIPKQKKLMYTLKYALQCSDAWPEARDLVLASAPTMEQVGYRDEWAPYLYLGVQLSRQIGDVPTQGELSYQLGVLFQRQSRFEESSHWLNECMECCSITANDFGRAKALNQSAYLSCLQHCYAEASAQVADALALASSNASITSMSYFIKGVIATANGNWTEAEIWHRKALVLRRENKDTRRIAWSLLDLAGTLRSQKRFREAIEHYQESATILDSLPDVYFWSHVQMNLGLAHCENGNAHYAIAPFQRAKTKFQQHYDVLNLGRLNTNMGLAYLELREHHEAEESFRRSIYHYQCLNDKGGELNATDGLAMTFLAQGRHLEAIAILENGLRELPYVVEPRIYRHLSKSMHKHLEGAERGLLHEHSM